MTGSFLFVKPSDQEGKRDTEDSGEPLQYSYNHASWEWLLERALRRSLLPLALTESHSKAILYGHEDKYSMHRWGSYGDKNYAGSTPDVYQSVGGPGSDSRKTDADLSDSDRETLLPVSWNSNKEVPNYVDTTVVYGIADLEKTVANLPFSLEWLHPDWSSSDLDAWDLTASTTEKTRGSLPPSPPNTSWTWETSVSRIPYTIPDVIPFKCLSHMRTDDRLVTVSITNDDDEEPIAVESSPTPVSAPRSTEGSIVEYNGMRMRVATVGAAYKAGWALSEFSTPYRYGLDYNDSTSSSAYGRGGKTDDKDEDEHTLGCIVDIPDMNVGIIAVSRPGSDGRTGFTHEVDWDGKPTYWHAKGFPKGLDSVISPRLEAQLKALCPVCQPAIPPAVPAFWEKFPGAGRLSWEYLASRFLDVAFARSHSLPWMRHLALACTPLDMSARLDAMTTTFHRVPKVFAKFSSKRTERRTTRTTTTESSSEGPGSSSLYWDDYSEEVTVVGTTSDPIPTTGFLVSMSGQGSGTKNNNEIRSGVYNDNTTWSRSKSEETQYTWEENFDAHVDFIVCLRSTENTTMSTKKTTTTTRTTGEHANGDPISSESKTSDGELPDSYDPDPDDLLFPDWVLPWIKTAELFASIESRLLRSTDADRTESNTTSRQDGETTSTYSGIGDGSRTHEAHRKIISLGLMDISTGRFPAIDVAAILSTVDPDAADPTSVNDYMSYNSTYRRTSDKDGNYTESRVTDTKDNNRNKRSRSVSYYVAVKWKFDRTDPETLETEVPLADLYRKLADAEKALSDKMRELSDAESALRDAESYLSNAEDALELAQKRLKNPGDAEAGLLEEAQAALDRANDELSDAQLEKSSAQSEFAAAEVSMQSAEGSLQAAQAAYDAAVAAGEGVEAAKAALESAYTAYYEALGAYGKASGRLTNAETSETAAQQAADAAQDHYDTLHENIMEILQKAVDDAQAAVDEATSRVNEWEQKVSKIEGAIPGLEDAIEAAKQAIEDAIRNA